MYSQGTKKEAEGQNLRCGERVQWGGEDPRELGAGKTEETGWETEIEREAGRGNSFVSVGRCDSWTLNV